MEVDYSGNESILRAKQRINVGGSEKWVDIPNMILLLAMSGHGKSSAMSKIAEYYHNNGYVVVFLTDQKDTMEFGFANFSPNDLPYNIFNQQQIEFIKNLNKEPIGIPTKIYHPYSFNLKKNTKYPSHIELFSFDIKTFDRHDFSLIMEIDGSNTILENLEF